MLDDRPAMKLRAAPRDVLYHWAARQFGGEMATNRILWSNEEPELSTSTHTPPSQERFGELRIAKTCRKDEVIRNRTFEELWLGAIFELNSVAYCRRYVESDLRIAESTIQREDYIRENFRLEFAAAQQTRLFYLDTFSNVLRVEGVRSDASMWFFHDAYLGSWRRGLTFYTNRKEYPWSVFGESFDKELSRSLHERRE